MTRLKNYPVAYKSALSTRNCLEAGSPVEWSVLCLAHVLNVTTLERAS